MPSDPSAASEPPRRRSALRRWVMPPLVLLAVLILLFEATFWRWMTALGHWLARHLPVLAVAERLIERMGPRTVGLVFIVPLAVLIPIKLAAVWLIVRGHFLTGLAVIIAAKVTATAISAHLFALAKPKLMQLRSFAWAYAHVTRWIALAHNYVEALPAWRQAKAAIERMKQHLAGSGLLGRLWSAARRQAARLRGISVTAPRN